MVKILLLFRDVLFGEMVNLWIWVGLFVWWVVFVLVMYRCVLFGENVRLLGFRKFVVIVVILLFVGLV